MSFDVVTFGEAMISSEPSPVSSARADAQPRPIRGWSGAEYCGRSVEIGTQDVLGIALDA